MPSVRRWGVFDQNDALFDVQKDHDDAVTIETELLSSKGCVREVLVSWTQDAKGGE